MICCDFDTRDTRAPAIGIGLGKGKDTYSINGQLKMVTPIFETNTGNCVIESTTP